MAEISETLIEDCVKSFTVLSSRVAVLSDSVNQMKEKQKNMDIKLDKISCVLLKKSDYLTVLNMCSRKPLDTEIANIKIAHF